MFLKRTTLILTLASALGLAGAASAVATPTHASVLIRHQMQGCHTWSVDDGAFQARQSITLRHGGRLAVTNNDVMPHTLVLTSGPAVRIAHAKLGHMGASLKITLAKPGAYHFTTKPGEDYGYMAGVKTTGDDNVLKLTVIVS
jgi:plastocyanin